jgi:hypothetical protein
LWADKHLKENDSRHSLFSDFGQLEVAQLGDLHDRAARCLYRTLESHIDKHSPLLFDVRLNRALDMLWYDPARDLTEWLPTIEEVDRAWGLDNPYSVYFLLIEAYRLVSQESHHEADQVCLQVSNRLADIKEGSIDLWRVGLAYRRLGRQQYSKERYADALRSFNHALKCVQSVGQSSMSISIEICQYQERIANALDDQEDAEFWRRKLQNLGRQAANQREADMLQQPRSFALGDMLTVGERRCPPSGNGRSVSW